jgi:hypothetical protein
MNYGPLQGLRIIEFAGQCPGPHTAMVATGAPTSFAWSVPTPNGVLRTGLVTHSCATAPSSSPTSRPRETLPPSSTSSITPTSSSRDTDPGSLTD